MGDLTASEPHRHTMERLEAAKRTSKKGVDFWMARELGPIMGYPVWQNFKDVIQRATDALAASGQDPSQQIMPTHRLMESGQRAQDFFLGRGGAYLITMNGEPSKPEIAAAQIYFAAKTRQMELEDQKADDLKRLEARDRVKQSHRRVSSAAQKAGVRNQMQGVFHDAGSQGLYGGLSRAQLKAQKGLKASDSLYDHAGPLELSANEFHNNLSASVIQKEGIRREQAAIDRHKGVGRDVRETMRKNGSQMPERLPLEPEPISAVEKRIKTQEKARLKGPTA